MNFNKLAHDLELLSEMKDFITNTGDNWNYILPTDLHGKLDNFFIVDLRKKEDFEKGHIPGAINIFWLDILDNLDKLPKDKKILLYCYLGHTSSQVLVLLKMLGYDVVSLKFGIGESPISGVEIKGWKQLGFELEK